MTEIVDISEFRKVKEAREWRDRIVELCLENSFNSLEGPDQEPAMELYRIVRGAFG